MDCLVQEILVEVVVDVLVAEAAGGASGANVAPVVVVVGNVQLAKVDVAQVVAVTNERRLPVVVEIVPGDSDPIGGAVDVDLAILDSLLLVSKI